MSSMESAPDGPGQGSESCWQAEACLQDLLLRAGRLAETGDSIETDPALVNGLDAAVADMDETNATYVLACQAVSCNVKYAVGTTIEPQEL